jgi:ABC-2 type transport system ATP-binding protein
MEVIRTENLTKNFGNTPAADDISLRIDRGTIYGFLGLNGAGKTTLIRILLGMIHPDRGQVTLFGQPVNSRFALWNKVGYLVETPNAYSNLSVYENLQVFFHLRKLSDRRLIDQVIDDLKLDRYRNTKSRHLSLGNKQRLGLAKALMHRPELLILDEPINGLDPAGIVEVRELLRQLAMNGSTIFLSSHILGEISKVVHRIGIIHQGKLLKEISIDDLHQQLSRKLLIKTLDNKKALQVLQHHGFSSAIIGQEIELEDGHSIEHPEAVSRLLVESGLPPTQIYLFCEDLEHYFLRHIVN